MALSTREKWQPPTAFMWSPAPCAALNLEIEPKVYSEGLIFSTDWDAPFANARPLGVVLPGCATVERRSRY
jgi:hypothetical protein